MAIVTDLEYIKEKALEREEENWEFRAFLKQLDTADKEIDAIVHEIADEVTSRIDCTQCANCCNQIRPVLDKEDISTFALGLKMETSEFQEQFLIQDTENSKQYIFKELPCPFLADNKCSNYDCRPIDCRSYPHLHKKNFPSRLWGVIENYGVCPIVFNVYEQLKNELWENNFSNNNVFEWG